VVVVFLFPTNGETVHNWYNNIRYNWYNNIRYNWYNNISWCFIYFQKQYEETLSKREREKE